MPLAQNADSRMSFFIERGSRRRSFAGADAHCQKLADAVGVGNNDTGKTIYSTTGIKGA